METNDLIRLALGSSTVRRTQSADPRGNPADAHLQLRELEEDGVIYREVYKQVPPKVEYSLTPFGRTIEPILLLMEQWGEQYADMVGTSWKHSSHGIRNEL